MSQTVNHIGIYKQGLLNILLFFILAGPILAANHWDCTVLPPEQKEVTDETSGARLVFVTTSPANDQNLYFHDRCWLLNNQMMLFYSDRSGRQELYGYYEPTGELIRLNRAEDNPGIQAIASRKGDRIFVRCDSDILEWKISLKTNSIRVSISERLIYRLPEGTTFWDGLDETLDTARIVFGFRDDDHYKIGAVDVATGKLVSTLVVDFRLQHIQTSLTRPDMIFFARNYGGDTASLDPDKPAMAKLWFGNLDTEIYTPAFYQQPGELVTHAHWFGNDQISFIGGHRPQEGHVKILDLRTNEIRIVGAGAWWEGADAAEISRYNWWHQSGSPDGRYMVADNWHGTIAVFNAKTTEMKILTQGHRTFGGGPHPHPGWDLEGKSVEFTSNRNGNADVCIGYLPEGW